jgi:hypothetical protein
MKNSSYTNLSIKKQPLSSEARNDEYLDTAIDIFPKIKIS